MDLQSPLLLYYAAAAGIILWLAWQILGGGIRRWRPKTLPPVGCHVVSLLHSFMGGTVPSFFLNIFRQPTECASLGVAGIGGGVFLFGRRGFLVGNHVVTRAILDHPRTIKWPQGFQVLVDTAGGMNIIAEAYNGPRWKHVRKSTGSAFAATNLQKMHHVMEDLVDVWIQTTLRPAYGQPLDIVTEMTRLTARVVCKVAFAYDLDAAECDQVLESLGTCWYEFSQMALSNPLRQLPTRWLFPGTWKGRRAARQLFAFGEKVLGTYRRRVAESPEEQQKHLLIDMIDQDSEYANDRERVSDLLAYVVAGFDTNANTLAFCFRELAKHPHEQNQLRKALHECHTDDERRYCPALRHVVRETLRMFPPVANGSLRITGADIPIPDSPEYVIPAQSIVLMPFYVIQRNAAVFANPDQFQPSRWENPTDAMLQAYIPFSTGRRNCQGQALAYAELYCILSRVLLTHEFYIVEEGTTTAPVLMEAQGLVVSAYPVNRRGTTTTTTTRTMTTPCLSTRVVGTGQRTRQVVETSHGWQGVNHVTQIHTPTKIPRA